MNDEGSEGTSMELWPPPWKAHMRASSLSLLVLAATSLPASAQQSTADSLVLQLSVDQDHAHSRVSSAFIQEGLILREAASAYHINAIGSAFDWSVHFTARIEPADGRSTVILSATLRPPDEGSESTDRRASAAEAAQYMRARLRTLADVIGGRG
jgi:hypothetical protein